jgi:tetratricopeptide (TPR) repeat protein
VNVLFEMYAEAGRVKEATELSIILRESPRIMAGSALLASELSIKAGNSARALELAAAAVPEDCTDPIRLLTLARILDATGQPPAAVEQAYRRAVQHAKDRPEPVIALAWHLAETNRPSDVTELLPAAAKVRETDRSLVLAQCHEAAGHRADAAKLYEQLVRGSDRSPVLSAAMKFFMRSAQWKPAEELCQRILGLKSASQADRRTARTCLGLILTLTGSYGENQPKLAALGISPGATDKPVSPDDSAEDLRPRALVLGLQPDIGLRRTAAKIWEAVDARQPLSPEESQLLARVYLSIGEWTKAKPLLTRTAFGPSGGPAAVASYGLLALMFDPTTRDAHTAVDWLKKQAPNTPQTVELSARVLVADGKAKDAEELLAARATTAESLPWTAGVAEALALPVAEKLYTRWAETNTAQGLLGLAGYLGRRGDTDAALQLVGRVVAVVPGMPEALAVAVETLFAAQKPTAGQLATVDAWLTSAEQKADAKVRSLLINLRGTWKLVAGQTSDAAQLYRTALTADPNNPLIANNLAYVVGVGMNQPEEAVRILEAVRRSVGRLPMLTDTEAVVHLMAGRPEKAAELLAEVIQESVDPTSFFHLAWARNQLGQTPAARTAIEQARRWRLRPEQVPAGERDQYVRLMERYPESQLDR